MSLTEALRLLITADSAGAVHGIEKVGAASKAADRHVKSSQASLDKWGRGLTTAGAGMVAFGGVALVGLAHAAKASEEANLSTVKLKNTIANMPKLAGESSKQFTDLAQKIQGYSAADGDAIVAGEAMLGTFNLTAKQIKDITPLVVDYSRKFGVDMVSAAAQVGKALDGNVGALKRNGVSIDEAMFKTDRYGAVQKALRQQVGGFARAEGATFAGSLERMKNQLGDLEEGVGKGAVKAFETLFGAVNRTAGALEKISPGTQSAIGKFATFGAVGLTAAGGLSFLVGQAIKARENFGAAASAVSGLTGKLGGLKTVAGVAGAAGAVIAVVSAVKAMDEASNRRTVDDLAESFVAVGAAADSTLRKLLESPFGDLVAKRVFGKLIDSNVEAAARFVDTARAAGVSGDAIARMRDKIEQKRKADQVGAGDQQKYTDAVNAGADAMDGQADATGRATAAAQEFLDAQTASVDPLFGATDALLDNAKAQDDVRAKTLLLAAAERDHGKGSAEAQAAQQALTEAQLAAGKSALSTDAALRRLKAGLDDGTVSVDDAKAAIRRMRSEGLIPAGSTADVLARQFDNATGKAEVLGRQRPKPRVEVVGINSAKVHLQQLKDKIDRFPRNIPITIHFAATGLAAVSIAEAKLLRPGGRQHGGPVQAGHPYVVGEAGPELFIPRQSGTVAAHGTRAMAAAGATYVTNVNVSMAGAIVSNSADADRWVAASVNRALANRKITVRGRPL